MIQHRNGGFVLQFMRQPGGRVPDIRLQVQPVCSARRISVTQTKSLLMGRINTVRAGSTASLFQRRRTYWTDNFAILTRPLPLRALLPIYRSITPTNASSSAKEMPDGVSRAARPLPGDGQAGQYKEADQPFQDSNSLYPLLAPPPACRKPPVSTRPSYATDGGNDPPAGRCCFLPTSESGRLSCPCRALKVNTDAAASTTATAVFSC